MTQAGLATTVSLKQLQDYERKGFSVLSDEGNRLAINKKVLAEEVKYVK